MLLGTRPCNIQEDILKDFFKLGPLNSKWKYVVDGREFIVSDGNFLCVIPEQDFYLLASCVTEDVSIVKDLKIDGSEMKELRDAGVVLQRRVRGDIQKLHKYWYSSGANSIYLDGHILNRYFDTPNIRMYKCVDSPSIWVFNYEEQFVGILNSVPFFE